MQIQKLIAQNVKNKQFPAQAAVVQLLDEDQNHLDYYSADYLQYMPNLLMLVLDHQV